VIAIKSRRGVLQRTLANPVRYQGIGLHSGKKVVMRIYPGNENQGIVFLRKDVGPGRGLIKARWNNVVTSSLCTVIRNRFGTSISTIEHLMAAFYGCGIDNALVEVDGPEVPIMDGSALAYTAAFRHVGTLQQNNVRSGIRILRPIEIRDNGKYAAIIPSDTIQLSIKIDFPNTIIGKQTYTFQPVNNDFYTDIAKARTFGFSNQITILKKQGLIKGGSLQNAILVNGYHIVNKERLRYQDEFVRHKMLDCIGDLSLFGMPIIGHFIAIKPGHELNNHFMRHLYRQRDAWSYITLDPLNARPIPNHNDNDNNHAPPPHSTTKKQTTCY